MTAVREELVERRDQALQDLTELDRQVQAGEVTERTAERLRARYEVEAADAISALDRLGQPDTDGRSTGDSAANTHQADDQPRDNQGVSRRRWAAVAVAAALVVAAGAVLLPRSLAPRPAGGAVTGNEAAGGRDLSNVNNTELEQVVADNPDVIGMRLALARRYFESGELDRSLEHYQQVLDREPHPEALANVGWILYTSTDQTQAAARFVEESLERDPDQRLAAWFLANIRLEGLDDPAGAAQIARRLLERDDLSPDDRTAIRQLLERAENRIAGDTP